MTKPKEFVAIPARAFLKLLVETLYSMEVAEAVDKNICIKCRKYISTQDHTEIESANYKYFGLCTVCSKSFLGEG